LHVVLEGAIEGDTVVSRQDEVRVVHGFPEDLEAATFKRRVVGSRTSPDLEDEVRIHTSIETNWNPRGSELLS
jgi:hypothetical protein